jgi:hypothetical protein
MLPSHMTPTHAHEQMSGSLLVHTHQDTQHSHHSDHSSTLDHGAEKQVLTASHAFKVERTVSFVPLMPAVDVSVPPEITVQSLSNAEDDPVIHGPPVRVPSLRAPPA